MAATTSKSKSKTAKPVELNESQYATATELHFVKKHIRTLDARKTELTEELKGVVRGTGGGTYDGALVVSVADRAGRRQVDLARLLAAYPEAYAACVSEGSPSEVLTVHIK